jgi:hypothetical protein
MLLYQQFIYQRCAAPVFFSPGKQPEQVGILIHFWTFQANTRQRNENSQALALILGWYEMRKSYILFYCQAA